MHKNENNFEIIEKEYHPVQQMLIDILRSHIKNGGEELPVVFTRPNIPNKALRHINRIPCKTIGKKGDRMIISMEIIDFVRLMVKSGIEIQIYDW